MLWKEKVTRVLSLRVFFSLLVRRANPWFQEKDEDAGLLFLGITLRAQEL